MEYLGSYRVPAIVMFVAIVGSIIAVMQWQQREASSPYVSVEGYRLFEPDAFDDETLKLVRESEAAAARSDLSSALESMRRAVAHHHETPNSNFELWDNLAELYCARARTEADTARAAALRSTGLTLLREFKCGVDLWDLKLQCRDIANRDGLCFRTLCEIDRGYATGKWDGFMDAEPEPGSFTWYIDDAKNLGAIDRVCRKG